MGRDCCWIVGGGEVTALAGSEVTEVEAVYALSGEDIALFDLGNGEIVLKPARSLSCGP